ncbi:restriction endonuclease subunit S [uncultured Thiodictyon sp.]|uniref:restriction endonuclease subunit S n=3 Tax=uncultured Thiodictyon sp. TaxID=1846217 RepID=UPI0025EAA928|nr:restriction endonuclease subunit S [uncultured Thiodictyon sp.]
MNPAQLLKHFDRIAEAPDAVPRLRRFILDLAVRGKLVEQNPSDEPAAELFARIQTEKAKLEKNTKSRGVVLKKPVPPRIAPFQIPVSWVWVTFGQVMISRDGERVPVSKEERNQREKVYDYYGASGAIDKIDGYLFDKPLLLIGEDGANLINRSTPIAFMARGKYWVNNHAHVLDGISEQFLKFVELYINSIDLKSYVTGTAQPKMNQSKMNGILIALPPEAEQKRIVAKVDELMALCDQLEAAQSKREQRRDRLVTASLRQLQDEEGLAPRRQDAKEEKQESLTPRRQARQGNCLSSLASLAPWREPVFLQDIPRLTTRPEHIKALRQTILSLAVRGHLVAQDSNDEPATDLLKQIQAEKAQLLKVGGRKQETGLPVVDLKKAPFNLPTGWAWARFSELGTFGRGKSKHRPRNDAMLYDGGTHLFIQTGDVARSQGVIRTYTKKYNEAGLAQSMKWPAGTLCITIAANIADSGILSFDACFPDSVVGFIPASMFQSARYFEYFVRTTKENLLAFAPATAQKNINLEILNAVLIPLPPLSEQHRIVAKVDELMAICDQLEANLTTTQADSRRLLEAVLRDALA